MPSSKATTLLTTLVVLLGTSMASGNQDVPQEESTMFGCLIQADLQCVKGRVVSNVRHLVEKKSLDILDGVQLQYSGNEADGSTARANVDGGWSGLLVNVLPGLVRHLSLRINMFGEGGLLVSRSQKENGLLSVTVDTNDEVTDARGTKTPLIFPFLFLGGLYTFLVTQGLIASKLVGFQSLLVGSISLVLAVITGLSKLFDKKNYHHGYTYVDAYGHIEKSHNDHNIYNSVYANKPRNV